MTRSTRPTVSLTRSATSRRFVPGIPAARRLDSIPQTWHPASASAPANSPTPQ